jgi:hypothetical protein
MDVGKPASAHERRVAVGAGRRPRLPAHHRADPAGHLQAARIGEPLQAEDERVEPGVCAKSCPFIGEKTEDICSA